MKFKLIIFFVSFILVSNISCDTCDNYKHPIYGYGKCVEQTLCPNSLYINNLCESKPASVQCCFSLTSTDVPCPTAYLKLTHEMAVTYVSNVGITIASSGECSDRNNPTCTSLEQVNCKTIYELVNYKKMSGCPTVITGGTEIGHSSGTQSHWNGYKIDIRLNSCHESYIPNHFVYDGIRGDGAILYKDSRGNTFALEANDHWDILFP